MKYVHVCLCLNMCVKTITLRVFPYNWLLLQDHNDAYEKKYIFSWHTHSSETYKQPIIQAFLSWNTT